MEEIKKMAVNMLYDIAKNEEDRDEQARYVRAINELVVPKDRESEGNK